MSNNNEVAGLYSVIEESSRLAGITCARDKVWPILTAYGDALAQAVVAFRVATGERNAKDFDCRFTMLPKSMDPYAVALSNGLTVKTDHPVGSLLEELHREFPVESSGIDFGVVGGFKKTWSFFPTDALQSLSDLVRLESLPAAVAGNLDFFTRYGLADKVSLVGIDYPSRSVNLYFGAAPEENFRAEGITSILRDAGLPAPSDRLIRLGTRAFGIYATLTWDSPKVERITIAAMTPDPTTLPVRIEPKIEHYVKNAPYSTDDRQFVYAITSSPKGEYHKLQSYYKWQSRVENVLLVSDDVRPHAAK
ncbi:aromatic prenyltransferase [Streptomyces sp. MMG1121]|uniref:aromatic prenyltransferase n=1 Tax=Streptomyces sp. MMG1121 TaxID=1415544 RepID=UPI0006C22353|nr:aromatic prenyltransferase [Streptomyces sp. MMG1121]KOV57734.1 aromatic prenyltransferase [Streptomyces sp. MMG1121]